MFLEVVVVKYNIFLIKFCNWIIFGIAKGADKPQITGMQSNQHWRLDTDKRRWVTYCVQACGGHFDPLNKALGFHITYY